MRTAFVGSFLLGFLAAFLVMLAACTSPAQRVERIESVSFRSTQTDFDGGDRIEIESVSLEDGSLRAGGQILVRGRWRLESQPTAWLGFALADGEIEGDMWQNVRRGEGEFEFRAHVLQPGRPRVALYTGDGAYARIGTHAFELHATIP